MAIQMEKKILPETSPQSAMLVKQAKKEMRETGQITVKCPKCQTIPQITMTLKGERTTVFCECGYIFDEEINL